VIFVPCIQTATGQHCGIHGEDVADPNHIEGDLRVVSLKCPAHSTRPVYCSCKQPEDFSGSKDCVRCDSCCDWFHTSCEGVGREALDEVRARVLEAATGIGILTDWHAHCGCNCYRSSPATSVASKASLHPTRCALTILPSVLITLAQLKAGL
jgi:hypothetical protein